VIFGTCDGSVPHSADNGTAIILGHWTHVCPNFAQSSGIKQNLKIIKVLSFTNGKKYFFKSSFTIKRWEILIILKN